MALTGTTTLARSYLQFIRLDYFNFILLRSTFYKCIDCC